MKKFAPLFVILAGVLWGSMGIFVRRLQSLNLNTMEIVALRAFSTTALLFIFLLVFDRDKLRIKLKDIWCFIGTGIVSILFFNFCYFKAITVTSLSVACVLMYTAPAFVIVFSFFLFKEKLTKRKLLAFALTFIGCCLVTGIFEEFGVPLFATGGAVSGEIAGGGLSGSVSSAGILLGLGAGIGYAMYSIFSRFALKRGYSPITITFYTFFVAAIGSVFLADLPQISTVVFSSGSTFLLSIALGIMNTILPYFFYTKGMQHMENGKAAIFASVEPVTATLIGFVLYNEILTIPGIAGVIAVIIALSISD